MVARDGNEKPDNERSLGELKLKYEGELKRLQTEQQEMKNAIQAGDYVAVTEIVSELSRHMIALKRSLMGLSRKITTEIAHFVDPGTARKIERGISEIVADALLKISCGDNYGPPRRKYIKTR
jgi:septation ring formation regulator EzrA